MTVTGSTTTALEQAHVLLDQLARERFFGTVSFQFKDGTVVLIRKEETILPTTPNGRTGGNGYDRTR